MKLKPLTVAEKAWLKKLETVMKACPSPRLGCFTIGDNNLMFYDKDVIAAWRQENPRAVMGAGQEHDTAGSYLTSVTGSFQIDSCAG